MKKTTLIIDKNTRKLWRLQISEKYITKRTGNTDFEVFTKDLKLKACVSTLGTLLLSNCEDYDKVEFHKLVNFSKLLQVCHFGI